MFLCYARKYMLRIASVLRYCYTEDTGMIRENYKRCNRLKAQGGLHMAKIDNLLKAAKGAVDTAKETVEAAKDTVKETLDVDGDGKLDVQDFTIAKDKVKVKGFVDVAKQQIEEKADENTRQRDLKTLQPIKPDELNTTDFDMPKFIRIVSRGKKFVESEVCQGSVGHISNPKDTRVVNIFRDSVNAFGLTFYPDNASELYYVDPSEPGKYIALAEYFNYLKIARVSELQTIAQKLGEKHFRVTYRDEAKSSSSKKAIIQMKGFGSGEHNVTSKSHSTTKIEADMTFPGHSPEEPQLKYMKNDPSIQSLIAMRMDEKTPLLKQHYQLQMSNSSGMKYEEAVKLDTILKELKCAPNVTFASEVENESKRYLEYDIEF